nr:hypothetical protein [Halorubrum ezzemoulense]
MWPDSSMATRRSRSWTWYHSMSFWSPNVQHITMPEPVSMSTRSSAMIGTSWPNSGTSADSPTRSWFSSSSGWTKTATHAGRSSGRVVEITNSSAASSFPSRPATGNAMSLKWLACSSSSVSTCEMAVSHSGHQIAGAFSRYSRPCSYRSTNDSCETRWTRGSIVWYVWFQSTDTPSDWTFSVNCSS